MTDVKRDKAGRWKAGQSPNPAGRPKGAGLSTKLRRAIEQDAPEIIEAMVDMAKQGDTTAARLLLDRVCPPLKAEAQQVDVAGMATGGLVERATAALNAAAIGELAPDTAAALVAAVGTLARVTEIDELEKRLARIEQQQEVAQ